MVELVIVISIVGVLATVSRVYFNHYRAKSKTTEAKLSLSGIYTTQQIFLGAFDIYSNCLDDMGFEIASETGRHYAIGFPSISADIDDGAYQMATRNGLPLGTCSPTLSPGEGQTFYLPDSGAGGALMDSQSKFANAIENSSNNLSQAGLQSGGVQEGLGRMSAGPETLFVVPAAGYIDVNFIEPSNSSLWSIDSNKLLRQHRKGF